MNNSLNEALLNQNIKILNKGIEILDLDFFKRIDFYGRFQTNFLVINGKSHLIFHNKYEDRNEVGNIISEIVESILTAGIKENMKKRLNLYSNKVNNKEYDIYTLTSIYYAVEFICNRKFRTLIYIMDWLGKE